MLAEDLDSRQHVPGREVRYFAPIISNEQLSLGVTLGDPGDLLDIVAGQKPSTPEIL